MIQDPPQEYEKNMSMLTFNRKLVTYSTILFMSLVLLIQTISPVGLYADPPKESSPSQPAQSFRNAEMQALDQLVGKWKVVISYFNSKGQETVTSKGEEDISWKLDGHAISRNYTVPRDTGMYRANGWLTYNDVEKKYQGVWLDNVSTTGLSTVTGQWDSANRTFSFVIESMDKNGAIRKLKVLEKILDDETRVVTTYRLDGDGVVKILEARYQRAAPCPAGEAQRMIVIGD